MFTAFKQRKPWATALIATFFGSLWTFYLGKPRLGVAYLLVGALVAVMTIGALLVIHAHVPNLDSASTCVVAPIYIFSIVHSVIVARRGVPQPTHWSARWYSLFGFAVVLFVLPDILKSYVIRSYDYPGWSMIPALQRGDYFLVTKYNYRLRLPSRGDVVVYTLGNIDQAMRIVGLPGDRVQLVDGHLHLNGVEVPVEQDGSAIVEAISPSRKYPILVAATPTAIGRNTPEYTVPNGRYFILGDNRDQAQDSRWPAIGFIPEQNIKGKVLGAYWNSNTKQTGFRRIE